MRVKLLIVLLILTASVQLTAQGNPTGDKEVYKPLKFLPIHRFPIGILHVYRYTDTSEVIRYLPDSTQTSYKRIITHFFTLNRVNPDKNGFMTLEVSMDSTRYYLKEGNAELYWDSQDDKSGGINMQDLKYATVPLGHYFDMTFSPYGEIAKISGENVDWYFGYLDKYADQLKDSVEKFIWYDGMSIKRIAQITDVRKIDFPNEKVYVDSTWLSPFEIQVENINFIDTVTAKIVKIEDGYMTIEADAKNLRALKGNYLFYNIKDMLLPVLKSKGIGRYMITLNPRGNIEKSSANLLINLEIPVHNDIFKLKIKSSMHWDLLGMYKE